DNCQTPRRCDRCSESEELFFLLLARVVDRKHSCEWGLFANFVARSPFRSCTFIGQSIDRIGSAWGWSFKRLWATRCGFFHAPIGITSYSLFPPSDFSPFLPHFPWMLAPTLYL